MLYLPAGRPEAHSFVWFRLRVTLRERMEFDADGNRVCVSDPEYSYVACMEEHVRREVGCASPWDLTQPREV